MSKKRPEINILAGPNGSGKTTLSNFLKQNNQIYTFLNADIIASGLGNSNRSDILSGKVLLKKLNGMLNERENFSFETTLSGTTWVKFIQKAQKLDYLVKVYFIFVDSEDLAIQRIAHRVKHGGHDIPVDTVRRRFRRSIDNFNTIYKELADKWFLFNNSEDSAIMIAKQIDQTPEIIDSESFNNFEKI